MSTKIEWTVNEDGTKGQSINPMTGCSQISEGCRHCFAKRMAHRLAGRFGYPRDEPFRPGVFHPDKLDAIANAPAGKRLFVGSMADMFHEQVNIRGPEIRDIFRAIASSEATCMILTKRPGRMANALHHLYGDELAEAVPNLWVGASAENQKCADARMPVLLSIPAAMRFVSMEPLLVAVVLGYSWMEQGLGWIINGAETGAGARPMDPDWARAIRCQCQTSGVPFFVKKMSRGLPTPPDLDVHEFPEATA